MEDGLKRKLQERCDDIERLLTEAGYKTLKIDLMDHGGQVWVLARVSNYDLNPAKETFLCKT